MAKGCGIGCLVLAGLVTLLVGSWLFAPRPPTPPPVPPVVGTLNQTVNGPDWSVIVSNVVETPVLPEGNGRQFTPQGKYVLVYLSVRNDGKKQNSLGFSSFTLYDSVAREYSPAQAAPGRDGNPTYRASENATLRRFTTDLLPSLTLDTVLAFDVVPNASGFQLGGPTLGKNRIALGQ